jgi:hypothetical protein
LWTCGAFGDGSSLTGLRFTTGLNDPRRAGY